MNMETRNDHHLNIFEPNLRCWLVQVDPTGIALKLDRENSSWTLGDLPYEQHGSILSRVIPPKNGGFLLIWRYFGEISLQFRSSWIDRAGWKMARQDHFEIVPLRRNNPQQPGMKSLGWWRVSETKGTFAIGKRYHVKHSSFRCHQPLRHLWYIWLHLHISAGM